MKSQTTTNPESEGIAAPEGSGTQNALIRAANSPTRFGDAIERVRDHEVGLRFDPIPSAEVRVEGDRLFAGDRELRLGKEGLARLCRSVKAPDAYLSRLGPKMRSRLLQYHLRRGDFRGDARIASRGGVFLDLQRADLYTLTGSDVLDALRSGIPGAADALQVQSLQLAGETLILDLVSLDVAEDVRPGDAIRGGIHLEHSLLGDRATTVMAYVLRLVCSNGLVHRECIGANGPSRSTRRTRRLTGDRSDARGMQMGQIRTLVAAAWGSLGGKLAAIRKLKEESLQTPDRVEKVFAQFLRNARMYSANLMTLLLWAWGEERGGDRELTRFGVLNALTWLATHARTEPGLPGELTERQAAMLSRLAGVFANQSVHICPSCFRIVAG